MTAIIILVAMFGAVPVPATTPRVATAIDTVCAGDRDCVLDAIASCWCETRCQLGLTSHTGAAGPWQQQPQYAYKIDGTREERQAVLNTDALAAMRQFAAKRARYSHTHYDYGDRWPIRYAGDNARGRAYYAKKWLPARRWAGRIARSKRAR